ncbi:MAG: isoprenylcysteine carboxylmethyltransferase family protein [Acidobacteriia bacterium]|nr:isoprenylcysteine carboxylmethyltransferase family protein [Terriglobia bacterium]
MTLLRALDLGLLFLWLSIDFVVLRRRGSRDARRRDRLSHLGIVVATVVGIVASTSFGFAGAGSLGGLTVPAQIAGLGLLAAGIAFRFTAIFQLGALHMPVVAIQPGHRVVDTGLYRHIRHPSYLGACIGFLGFGLGLGNWLSGVSILGCVLVGYLYRIHVEEEALLEALGEEYAGYRRRTRRLIPGVY